jgi:putative heme-binding domain-containing protein
MPRLLILVAWLFAVAAAPPILGDDQAPPPALSPQQALQRFTTPDDLQVELVLAEPVVRQPVFMNFDERGRLWVVQYVQYPYPAGLKMLSKDEYWRAQYDKVPLPPPQHTPGLDKITIHEDTDGDGGYDHHKTFLEGLSIVTSVARGRGGVWVLNPPYLLFYPDANGDDVPDGDPQVHLEGFGMEDTHSVCNSLRWGPDGWLYAAQGSTVSGQVRRPGDKQAVHSMGQLIWRYHPPTRRYEIFAEGGGNAFGVEFDDRGRVFSGHNGGNTRGFHYPQGGYLQKGFTKHGPLSNPYSFGYFPAMAHHDVPRFTHNFVLYDGGALPGTYRGKLLGVAPLLSHVVLAEMLPDGSTFKTKDLGYALSSSDPRFRPVDIKVGPDGAVYVADFYEPQISHREHFSGRIEKETGRIYRLRSRGAAQHKPVDLGSKSTAELVEYLSHPNKWFRQTAVRLLADRHDAAAKPLLLPKLLDDQNPFALDALWGLYVSSLLDEPTALAALQHADPHVRLWTVRLLCDEREVSSTVAARLAELAQTDPHVEVRSQLACSARRLPVTQCLPIVRNLLARDDDAADPRLPLLIWWAIEAHCAAHPQEVLAIFPNPSLWQRPLAAEHLVDKLMRRFAQAGSRQDLLRCARLLEMSPDPQSTSRLMAGFEAAFAGRSLAAVPAELAAALAKSGGASLALRLRQGDPAAVDEALRLIAADNAAVDTRLQYVEILGQVDQPRCVPLLLKLVESARDDHLRKAALVALQRYADPAIGQAVLGVYGQLSDDVRPVAQSLLVSRKAWALRLVEAVAQGQLDKATITLDTVRQITVHRDERLAQLVLQCWGDVQGATTAEMSATIERLGQVLQNGQGDPYNGKKLFTASCAKCHTLFFDGGKIGPDLTSYKRDDLPRMLLSVVNPSAEIREGFETYLAITGDGRAVTGFLADRDNRVLVLRGADGQNILLQQDQIEELQQQKKSLMPEGLLNELSDQQVRDLFAYLRSSQPLNN